MERIAVRLNDGRLVWAHVLNRYPDGDMRVLHEKQEYIVSQAAEIKDVKEQA